MKQILIWGGIPEPIGGQTNHIFHLASRLEADGYGVVVVDTIRSGVKYPTRFFVYDLRSHFFKICVLSLHSINHIHVSNLNKIYKIAPFILLSLFIYKRSTTLLTIHSGQYPVTYDNHRGFKQKIIDRFLSKFGTIIAINKQIEEHLRVNHYRGSIIRAHSYIAYDQTLKRSMFDKNNIKVITSGYLKPIYNYDGLIHVIKDLNRSGYNIQLSIVLYGDQDEGYKKQIKADFNEDFVTVHQSMSLDQFSQLLADHDVYVRNTDADSYGLAVAEALTMGVPALATDVTDRPNGSILYQCRKSKSLKDALAYVINNYSQEIEKLKTVVIKDSYDTICSLYSDISSSYQ
ncbi:glycosyltransferase family 4 protein [candidate division KSB1 bacterium]|nr:glycosyltransferase family 4 protein [candidate division KSB1 bacterium]